MIPLAGDRQKTIPLVGNRLELRISIFGLSAFKVAGQIPEVSTGIGIETRRNLSKPIETCQNQKVSTFAKMGLGFCPATL